MRTLANLALLLPLALWSGSAFFFTVVAAPRLFATMERPVFATVVSTLFPIYFALGVVLLGISGLTAWLRAWRECARGTVALAGLVTIAWLGMLSAATIIEPQIGIARALAGTPEGEALFRRAHGLSMLTNAVAMVAAFLAWLIIAYERRQPASPAVDAERTPTTVAT